MNDRRDIVLVTGSAGGIGTQVTQKLRQDYRIVGFDLEVEEDEQNFSVDLTSDESVHKGLARVRERYGARIEAVIHLAAYFDFSGEESPLYRNVNVEGTRRLLDALQKFDVGHFFYSSTMLVHEETEPGMPITEESALGAHWAYPQSKLATEKVIEERHGRIPYTLMRLAGVYDEDHLIPTLAHQVQRIYERNFQSHLFSGDVSSGQSFIHSDDVVEAFCRAVSRSAELADTSALLIGEPEALSYEELQNRFAQLIHGENWQTWPIPKPVAKLGSWLQVKAEVIVPDAIDQGRVPFIKPFMIPLADDHYELDISRARQALDWQPRRSLRECLPAIVSSLKEDPEAWYANNKLTPPVWMTPDEADGADIESLRAEHDRLLRKEHRQYLWAHFLTIALGTWLVTSPPTFGYQSTPLAISDIVSGTLIVLFASMSLSWRMPWARLLSGLTGFYLLFAPLIFWAPTAGGYLNDTLVGALVIGFSMLVRPPVGVSMIARMTGPDVPDGWDYSPSTWTQRLPIIALAFIGLYVSRYLTAYQLGHIDQAWDPFFGTGTEQIITSDVSKAWPVPDAGVDRAAGRRQHLLHHHPADRDWHMVHPVSRRRGGDAGANSLLVRRTAGNRPVSRAASQERPRALAGVPARRHGGGRLEGASRGFRTVVQEHQSRHVGRRRQPAVEPGGKHRDRHLAHVHAADLRHGGTDGTQRPPHRGAGDHGVGDGPRRNGAPLALCQRLVRHRLDGRAVDARRRQRARGLGRCAGGPGADRVVHPARQDFQPLWQLEPLPGVTGSLPEFHPPQFLQGGALLLGARQSLSGVLPSILSGSIAEPTGACRQRPCSSFSNCDCTASIAASCAVCASSSSDSTPPMWHFSHTRR
jgi:nucleoside-diphosphate-sugar epimerase